MAEWARPARRPQAWAARGRLLVTGTTARKPFPGILGPPGGALPLWLRLPEAGPAGFAAPGPTLTLHTRAGPWALPLRRLPVEFLRAPARRGALEAARAEGRGFDVCAAHPETLHALLHACTDAGHPAAWREAALHAREVYGAPGPTWLRLRLLPLQAAGEGPAPAALLDALARGEPARWRLMAQAMTEAEAQAAPFDAFDATRLWPEARWPFTELGVVVLEGRLDLPPAVPAPPGLPGLGPGPRAPRRPRAEAGTGVAGAFHRTLAPDEQERLADRLGAALRPLPEALRRHWLALCAEADPALGLALTRRLRPRPVLLAVG